MGTIGAGITGNLPDHSVNSSQQHYSPIGARSILFNLNANTEEWPKSRQRLMDAAVYGNLAGATDIIFHPGSYFGQSPDQVLPIAIERLQECVHELHAQGNPVTLRPETMGKSALLGSIDDVIQMSLAIPGVLPCLDFAHLHARQGNGTLNSFTEWIDLLQKIKSIFGKKPNYSLHIHLSGNRVFPKRGEEASSLTRIGSKSESTV